MSLIGAGAVVLFSRYSRYACRIVRAALYLWYAICIASTAVALVLDADAARMNWLVGIQSWLSAVVLENGVVAPYQGCALSGCVGFMAALFDKIG
jgi:hypothetical protein